MKSDLIKHLVCPECKGSFAPLHVSGEAMEENLACQGCGRSYPIRRGIPRFVESDTYVKNFSFEWVVHKTTQLDGVKSRESEVTFKEKTGLTPNDIRGKLVLDVGCGTGRFGDVVSRWGGIIVGLDLSLAVESAYQNIGRRDNAHIIQADVFKLPFREKTFDIIFSIGVLHHTPDCQKAFKQLPSLLKPGGTIAIWLYSKNILEDITLKFSELYRKFTTKLPSKLLHLISYSAVPLYYINKIPVIGSLTARIFPISQHPNWRWRVLDTFDWYSPKYQSKHTYPEVYRWFKESGLVEIDLRDSPVAISGKMPE